MRGIKLGTIIWSPSFKISSFKCNPRNYLSLISLFPIVTYQNIFVSSDLSPDLDLFQGITRSFSKTLHERNQTMYNYMVTQLQNFKLQMQYMVNKLHERNLLHLNRLHDRNKLMHHNTFVSYDLAPDIDPFQVITWIFSEPSNLDPKAPRLQTQTRFVTPLSCDLQPDITKPTSRKIFVSAETKPFKSDSSSFRILTQLTKLDHFHQITPLTWKIVTAAGLNGVAEYKILTITQSTSKDSIYKSKMSRLRNLRQMIKVASCQRLKISKSKRHAFKIQTIW